MYTSEIIKPDAIYKGFFNSMVFSKNSIQSYFNKLGYLHTTSSLFYYYSVLANLNNYSILEDLIKKNKQKLKINYKDIIYDFFRSNNFDTSLLNSSYAKKYFDLIEAILHLPMSVLTKLFFDTGKILGLYGLNIVNNVPFDLYKINYSLKEEEILTLLNSISSKYFELFDIIVSNTIISTQQLYKSYETLLRYLIPCFIYLYKSYENELLRENFE
ncbi:hypothetical protein [Deferribacter desulfuricans]|uniref:hypothetical protein n=1 Tax=Deferribacter desulfuricans TaxID=197162 RepID=UPI0002F7050F|nr:hypothetical protein [Deferribacter desulfuricans]